MEDAMKETSYLVVWGPDDFPCPISKMRVIDAFVTTGTIKDARDYVERHMRGYRARVGPGDIRVVKSLPDFFI
jgi:hypothetical protein